MVSISPHKLRRAAPWLALATIVIFIQCYFASIKNSYFVKNTLEVLRYTKTTEVRVGPLHVLLVAYARTGSSFIGDLMQSFPGSFYHFEPLHFIKGPVLNSSFDEARDLLDKLFNCHISQIDGFISWQMNHKQYMKFQRNIRYWKECKKNNSCFDGAYIDNFCRNKTIRIAKTIRLSLLEASKLFTSHPKLNLKIMYLTRDPRGTMNSRRKRSVHVWCRHDIMCSSSAHFCSGLRTDLETSCFLSDKRPNDFMVVRYEDVSINPFGVAAEITRFLGLDSVPDTVHQFLKTHTYYTGNVKKLSKAAGLEYSYMTVRNSSIAAMSWRKEMPFKNVTDLQNTCKDFLSAFGYHSYRTVAALRANVDLNTDLDKALESACDTENS